MTIAKTLHIYNSLTRQKEVFEPIEAGKVRMYVCGMTVYDYCHLGHARVLVVFDIVARYLRHLGYELTYVRNITDIDDKIIARANENGEDFKALTERFIGAMHEDAAALGVLPPDAEPRATGHMDEILEMIGALETKGYAYATDNGDVYYKIAKFDDYGRLSGKQLEDLRAGARVEIGEAKADPLDFVLWKAAKPGEPEWGSKWGAGRPGWHIECSAMSTHCLGEHFDIHGGGQDLQFPHHENEIAQSEAATGEHFVNYWMHNGFVRIDEEKMSKSLGNFFTIRDILKKYDGEIIRYFMLTSHYRSPLNYSDESLEQAKAGLTRLYTAMRGIAPVPDTEDAGGDFRARFEAALSDDFNTPEALAVLFDLVREINRARKSDDGRAAVLVATLADLAGLLGLLGRAPEAFLRAGEGGESLVDADIEAMIAARNAARAVKDFAEADRLRDALLDAGIILEDGAGATVWRRS